MPTFEYRVSGYDGVELTTGSYLTLFFYAWGREHYDLNHNNALKMANVAEMMYLKDHNPTPLGELANYVAVNCESLGDMGSIQDMISDFYNNCGDSG